MTLKQLNKLESQYGFERTRYKAPMVWKDFIRGLNIRAINAPSTQQQLPLKIRTPRVRKRG